MARPQLPQRCIVICRSGDPPRGFRAGVSTTCPGCGVTLYHRPQLPAEAITLCLTCALREDGPRIHS